MFAWILLTRFDDHYASHGNQPMVVQPIEVEAFAVPPRPSDRSAESVNDNKPIVQSDSPKIQNKAVNLNTAQTKEPKFLSNNETQVKQVVSGESSTAINKSSRLSDKSASFAEKARDGRVKAWVLQVGSFTEKKNADALKNKLLAKDFPAYVKTFNVNNTLIYRVLVGPKINKKAMQQVAKNIDVMFRLNSLIMEYKPGFAE
jgi:DedD protein